MDYLKLDLTTKQEMRDCCTIILTETWLNPSVSDDAVSIEGLTIFRSDRSGVLSGKSRGGGVCIYTNIAGVTILRGLKLLFSGCRVFVY